MTAGTTERSDRPWGMVVGLSLVTIAAAAYEIAPASVTPVLMERLSVGPTGAGWIVSIMLGVAVVASIPVGIGLDRTDPRVVTAGGAVLLVLSGLWGWQAAADGAYRWLLVSRVFGAIGYTVVWNASAHLIGLGFDLDARATAIGVFTASGTAGFALGQVAGPPIVAVFGPAAIFGAFGIIAVIGLGVFWPTSVGVMDGLDDDATRAPDLAAFRRVLTSRTVWHVCAMGFMGYSLFLFINSWMPTYLTERLGVSLAGGGLIVGGFAAIGILARTGGGVLSDRVFERRRRPVAIISFLVATPLVVGLALVDVVAVVIVLLIAAGFFVQLGIALFYTMVREVVDPAVAATAVSVMTSISLFGGFSAP
ncbi:MAG: MFS transporter, partial [Halobacteriales archaeon]|nr:MFS transporter [Halobacteriales archaeon]